MLTYSQICQAVDTRAKVRVSERNGYHKGLIGIAMGYRDTYGSVKIGFLDENGNYTGDYTTVHADHVELVEPETEETPKPAAAPTYRWIMYLHNPMGGFDVIRVRNLEHAKAHLVAYGENTGFGQSLQTNGEYGCTGSLYEYTEEMWADALEFKTTGCPFDYPAKLVKNGPRGGVRILEA